jgi:hypothetical protein
MAALKTYKELRNSLKGEKQSLKEEWKELSDDEDIVFGRNAC